MWLRRRGLWVLGGLGFVTLLALRRGEVAELGATLLQGQWHWVLAAVALQAIFYVVYSLLYQLSFATVEVRSRLRDLVPLLFASLFVKALVPSGGVSALALFVDDAARGGQSAARTAEGALLVLTADLVTMAPLILYGLAYLHVRGVLQAYQVIGVAFFLVFTAGLVGILLVGRWRPGSVLALMRWAQGVANGLARRLRRKPFLDPGWARRQAREITGAACDIAGHPQLLWRTLALAFVVHLINAGCLYAVALAYRWPLGIGVAEAAMALALASLGGGRDAALATTVAFRGLNVWLPLFIGFLLLQRVRVFSGRYAAGVENA